MKFEAVLDVIVQVGTRSSLSKDEAKHARHRNRRLELNPSHLSGKITRKRSEIASLCKTLDSAK